MSSYGDIQHRERHLAWDGQRFPNGQVVLEVESDSITNVPHDLLVRPSLRITALQLRAGGQLPGTIPFDHGGQLEPALHLLRWPSCKATDCLLGHAPLLDSFWEPTATFVSNPCVANPRFDRLTWAGYHLHMTNPSEKALPPLCVDPFSAHSATMSIR